MDSKLPFPIEDLLYRRGVEGNRIEFKADWNDGPVAEQVLHTICAFANDWLNVNGGFVVLGVEERDGTAALPPRGIEPGRLTAIQRSIRGQVRRIEPPCEVIPCHEVVGDRHLLVLWVPASEDRPHAAPVSRGSKERRHYIRLGAETVEARGRELEELIRRKGKTPFDDRPAPRFVVADLRSGLLREYLRETESRLFDEPDDAEVYRRLRLTSRTNGREVPRNVALMFFSDDPERAFPGSRIEFAQYGDGGDLLDEQTFRGPVHQQLRDCVRSLKGRVSQRVEKVPGQAESRTWVSYPFAAIEEAVGNAVHHRDYQSNEPTKILLHQDRLEIVSYPGPVPGLEREHFDAGMTPPIPSRNRRVGELLKELRLVETRYTGLARIHSAMAENGSPPPRFDFDQDRTYFRVTLPIHLGAVVPVSEPRSVERGEGLVLISVGAESLRPVVEASLPDLDLGGARVLIDLVAAEYLDADPESLEAEAKRIRNALREPLEEPDVTRLHLFYRGPLAMGPLLGAMFAAAAKPVVVYHYHDGRYTRAYVLDRRFLKAKD